jgi:hypothetical protein
MKKFLAILLAALLVLVNVAALASGDADTNPPENPPETPETQPIAPDAPAAASGPSFTKTYNSDAGVYPDETLSFTVTNVSGNPANTPDITVGTGNSFDVDGTKASYTIPINVPGIDDYPDVGKYDYTVKETAGSTQGVDYSAATSVTINVSVYIYYEKDAETDALVKKQKVNVYLTDENNKTSEIQNTYTVGELTVSKTVTGNLGDTEKDFTLEVLFSSTGAVLSDISISGDATVKEGTTAYTDTIPYASGTTEGWTSKTITVTAKSGQSATFTNIPTGVTYTVTEKDITDIEDTATVQLANVNDANAYAITYDGTGTSTNNNGTGDGTTGSISATASTASVTNNKTIDIPTGIELDTIPYILILAVAMMGAVVLASRKRREE